MRWLSSFCQEQVQNAKFLRFGNLELQQYGGHSGWDGGDGKDEGHDD